MKASIDVSKLLEDKDRHLKEQTDKYLDVRNQLYKLQHESTHQAWLLKKDVENLTEQNQILQGKIEEIEKNHKGNFPSCSELELYC